MRDGSRTYADQKSARAAIGRLFHGLDPALITALGDALIEQHVTEKRNQAPTTAYRLKCNISLSDLPLFETAEAAAQALWGILQANNVIKAPKTVLPGGRDFETQSNAIKALLRRECDLDRKHIDDAVDSVFAAIEPTIGMLRSLDDKKITVKFAAIAHKFFMDQGKNVPRGLREFVEAGLDVVTSVIEKKDPPTWYEVTALTTMGVAQIVAGVLIKEFVPVAGELIGNALINTGLDDIVFGVSSAISGEFSWGDYWEAKKGSMVNAVLSAAIVSAAGFASTALQEGTGKAWKLQQMTHGQDLEVMSRVTGRAGVDIASHVGKEIGRAIAKTGIAQVASRGMHAVVSDIAGTYAGDLKKTVGEAVQRRWEAVGEQTRALHAKLQGNASISGVLNDCMREVLRHASQEDVFSSLLRTSRPAISIAASSVANGGWGSVLAAGGDLASLGVSVARMATLVETEVSTLARTVRDAKERKTEIASSGQVMSQQELEALLTSKQAEFTDGLVNILNGLLSVSVYSPLISYATQFAADKVAESLWERTETELLAASPKHMLRALKQVSDAETAYFDDVLRSFRGAETEIDMDALSPERLADLRNQVIEGTGGQTLGQLESYYKGCRLRLYCDGEHRLYVQRPGYMDYSAGVRAGKPGGDPEIVPQAQIHGRPISLKDRNTGAIKTYHSDGRIDGATPANAIRLDYTPGEGGELGHITAAGITRGVGADASTGSDCLYTAIMEAAGSPKKMTIATERARVAQQLETNEVCKLFYHNWSQDGQVKEFVGKAPWTAPADLYDAYADRLWDQTIMNLVEEPSLPNYLGAVGKLTAVELGRGIPDMLRLGEGLAESTLEGVGRDALRLAGIVGAAGTLGSAAKHGAHYVMRGYSRIRLSIDGRLISRGLDRAFSTGRANTGGLFRFTDAGGPLGGSGPKKGAGSIWYHDNIKIPGAGPGGTVIELRTHSAHPKAIGLNSRSGYTTRITSGQYREYEFFPERGGWKLRSELTNEEINFLHRPAGN